MVSLLYSYRYCGHIWWGFLSAPICSLSKDLIGLPSQCILFSITRFGCWKGCSIHFLHMSGMLGCFCAREWSTWLTQIGAFGAFGSHMQFLFLESFMSCHVLIHVIWFAFILIRIIIKLGESKSRYFYLEQIINITYHVRYTEHMVDELCRLITCTAMCIVDLCQTLHVAPVFRCSTSLKSTIHAGFVKPAMRWRSSSGLNFRTSFCFSRIQNLSIPIFNNLVTFLRIPGDALFITQQTARRSNGKVALIVIVVPSPKPFENDFISCC